MPLSSSAVADVIYKYLTDNSLSGVKTICHFKKNGTCNYTTIGKIAARIIDVNFESDPGKKRTEAVPKRNEA